jgi:nucleoside-diphosphate-sugar epimerase
MVRVLLDANRDVAIVVRPGDPLVRLEGLADRLTLFRGDLNDRMTLRSALANWQPDSCIHLAWYMQHGKVLTAPENVPALVASLGLLDELIRVGCGHVLMAGTCAEYDTNVGFLREDGPARPQTLYGATKLSLGLIAQQVAAAARIDLVWARLFYLHGPFEDERRLVPAVIRALMRGEEFPATLGEQVRDYLHVEDAASALWALAERRTSGTVNVCSGVPVTLRQVMETIGEIVGNDELIRFGAIPYRDWDPPFICGDNRRLREAGGWTPKYPTLRSGLEATVAWWRMQGAQ